MKKSLLSTLALTVVSFGLTAQYWVEQTTGLASNHYVNYISIPAPDVVWATTLDATTGAASTREWLKTDNNGATWTKGIIASAPTAYEVGNIHALNKDTAWVSMYNGTSGSGGIFRTNNGGATWTKQTTATFTAPDGFPNFVYMWDANTGVSMGDPNGSYFEIYTTTNGGTNWTRVATGNIPVPLTGEFGYTNEFSVIGNTIWFATNKGRVFKSTDQGANWTAATTGFTDLSEIHFSDANNGIVEMVGTTDIRATTDGGATWSLVSYTGILYDTDITEVPGAPGMYYSAGQDPAMNWGNSFSTDYGVTWTDISNDTTIAISFYDMNNGWAGGISNGTTGGMFKFVPFPLGVKNTEESIKSLSVSPNPSNGIFEIKIGPAFTENTVSVYNVIGKQIYKTSFLGSTNKLLNLSGYPSGVYFVKLICEGREYSEKIIIQ